MADEHGFESHTHDAVVHSHEHWHVTHNFNAQAQTFVHLASQHTHEHDHAALEHAHFPHQDFESEHRGEAHDHYHADPVGEEQGQQAAPVAKKAPAKKAATKKATAKKAAAKKATARKS
ncbi:MAG TPA: hypothetical protein VM307_13020 [Egibacteraceae bacterium]|nr:hypothetical protein [Egibacteraceae bacterium]